MAGPPTPDFGEIGNFGNDVGVLEDFEPEVREGPLGIPYVKPKGAPELPDPTSGRGGPF